MTGGLLVIAAAWLASCLGLRFARPGSHVETLSAVGVMAGTLLIPVLGAILLQSGW